jgi:hypothetical protein
VEWQKRSHFEEEAAANKIFDDSQNLKLGFERILYGNFGGSGNNTTLDLC